MITKVVNFFKSKSVIDFLYLVMMIIVVTMIKDMVVSMYRKKGEMRWLDETFKKKEGFTTGCGGTNPLSTCDKLKFLTCTTNFDKLKNLLNNATNLNGLASDFAILQKYISADIINTDGNINTGGKSIYTGNGLVHTSELDTNSIRGRNPSGDSVDIEIQDTNINFYDSTNRKLNEITTDGVKTYYLYVKDIKVNRDFGEGYNNDMYLYPSQFNGLHQNPNAINWNASE